MGAYLINHVCLRDGIPCQEVLARVKRTVEAYGGKWLSQWEEQEIEGARMKVVVLMEFRTIREAETWYSSSDYDNLSRRYVDSAIDLALMDGVSPDFAMAGFAPA